MAWSCDGSFRYGLKGESDPEVILPLLAAVKVPVFVPKEGVKIAVTEKEAKEQQDAGTAPVRHTFLCVCA
jgi:hypothetical protein